MASSITTRLLEKSWISPPPNSVQDTSVPLTSFDLPWLPSPPIQFLFFYPSAQPAAPFIGSLKSSLSLTLQHFYTLAGTVHISPNKIDINYTNGDSNAIAFTVVESNSDFQQLASSQKRDYFTRVYPLLPHQSGLLAILVTVFPDHGICIGVTNQHVAGDGASIAGFLKSWASSCKSGGLPKTPIYDRGVITDIPSWYDMLFSQFQSTPMAPASPSPSPSKGAVLATFTLQRDQIGKLKKQVRERHEHIHCSTFVVSCAYAWVCNVKAQGYAGDSTVHFLFSVDCRERLDPPVPPSYFGNCLTSCLVDESVCVLIGEDGVVAAALGIGKAVEKLKDGINEAGEQLWKKLTTIDHEKMFSVAWSPKLGVYDVDFGWGRPVRVEVPSIQKTGAISLTEAKEDDGAVEIGVALEEGKVEQFEVEFYRGLEKLSEIQNKGTEL